MINKILKPIFFIAFLLSGVIVKSQYEDGNPNWTDWWFERDVTVEASSTRLIPPGCYPTTHLLDNAFQFFWETEKETTGAWITVNFNKNRSLKEVWILSKPVPFDMIINPYMDACNYQPAKKVTLSFSDGSTFNAELQPTDHFQIIKLPAEKNTTFVKVTINDVWPNSGTGGTGFSKIRAYSAEHVLSLVSVTTYFELYNYINNKPVKSAKIELVNPGEPVDNAHLVITSNNKPVDDVELGTLAGNTATFKNIWIRAPYVDSDYDITLYSGAKIVSKPFKVKVTAYRKTFFEGGEFNIHSTSHHDLGFMGTQYEMADYRSTETILPALKMMETDPDFKYTMESVESLKEFLVRYPQKKEEITKRMLEKRFVFGASYIQMLQVHIGPEQLVRQFYYGRRWLMENFPGVDTKVYMNADVPAMTYQLPQILKSAGIDYWLQGRIPIGYYYWQGLDGTIIPIYGMRYGWDLLNPTDGEGWMKYMNGQDKNYQSHNLPKIFNYDFETDGIPPYPGMTTFVKEQNEGMKNFAADWNKHFTKKEEQIQPPVLKFSNPEDMLKQIYSDPNISIETKKGEWPFWWVYYDEPSNKEGLLIARKAHNTLLSAEKLFSSLKQIDPSVQYPKTLFDSAWMAVCWGDHGLGGNKGLKTDSIFMDHYKRSYEVANSLMQQGMQILCKNIPSKNTKQIPLIVYNSLNWNRTDHVHASITLPAGWNGFVVKDKSGKTMPFELIEKKSNQYEILFVAENIPSTGYSSYFIEQSKTIESPVKNLTGDSIANSQVKILFGKSGIKQYTDKINNRNFLKTDKFEAGEILQFTAPGITLDETGTDNENVTMDDFDKSTNHESNVISFVETPIRFIREVETKFKNFTSVTRFIFYKYSNNLEVETDILDWNGTHNRELRIAFPFDIEQQNVNYEIPFGTVNFKKDEVDLMSWKGSFTQYVSGGKAQLPYREAINWINVSSSLNGKHNEGFGCLMASDITIHLFEDQTSNPVSYPVMQHVLLSTRKALAWNPDYWTEQKGNHHYRMAFYFHEGDWRFRYHDGIAFNYPMTTGIVKSENIKSTVEDTKSFLSLAPSNLIVTTMKQSEDGKGTVVRFYEAEGKKCTANIKLGKAIKEAYKTNLIEYEPQKLNVLSDGSVQMDIRPWEIVTFMCK